ncbi:MAG: hypothetical protein KDD45_07180 [Bdellovibrionales bacterium]|nr:hypothetical protein [Bdellovibrionales bacterium]
MKQLLVILFLIALAFSFKDYDCPHDAEVKCIDDVNKAFDVCEKAAKEKGADVPADLECMKYFAQLGEDCWDCICWIAQVQQV